MLMYVGAFVLMTSDEVAEKPVSLLRNNDDKLIMSKEKLENWVQRFDKHLNCLASTAKQNENNFKQNVF